MFRLKKNIILTALGLLMLSAVFISCGKDSADNKSSSNTEDLSDVDKQEFKESEEDLTNVDYSVFYDKLSPHGEWVQVSLDKIDPNASAFLENNENKSLTDKLVSLITGVNTAAADADVTAGVAFVWKPAAAVNEPAWVPYTDGQWLNTEQNGWYFQSAAEPVNVTYHYGRWWNSPEMGWVWLPGKVWSPSWVVWRESDEYVGWAPVPPKVYIVNNTISEDVNEDNYVIVEKRYFVQPEVKKYVYMYKEHKDRIMIKEMIKRDGPMVINRTIINKGPDPVVIRQTTGAEIPIYTVTSVNIPTSGGVTANTISTFTPVLREVKKNNTKVIISKPVNFVHVQDIKQKKIQMSNDGNYKKGPENNNPIIGNNNNNGNKQKIGKKNGGNDVIIFDKHKNKGNDNINRKNDNKNKNNSRKEDDHHNNKHGNDNGVKHNESEKHNGSNHQEKGGEHNKGKGKH